MPFIGKNPTAGFATIVKDDFTPNGTDTTFTLSKQVAYANDIAVFVGNVRQEPTTAYTVNGTTLDFGSGNAPANGLDMYVLHIGGTQEVSTIPADATISSSKIVSGAVTSAKLDTNIAVSGTLGVTGLITASAGMAVGGTGAVNTLDDYEEGTFQVDVNYTSTLSTSPSWSTYTNAMTGSYVKVGKLVMAGYPAFNMSTVGLGSSSGSVLFQSVTLPFTSNSHGNSVVVGYNSQGWYSSAFNALTVGACSSGNFLFNCYAFGAGGSGYLYLNNTNANIGQFSVAYRTP